MTVVSIYFAQDLLIFCTCISLQMITTKVLVSCSVAMPWLIMSVLLNID